MRHFPVQNIHIRIQNNYSPKRYILFSETKSTEKYVEPSKIVDSEDITTYSGLTSTTIECEGNNINGYVILFNEPMYLTQCQPAVDTDNFYLLVENETEFAMFI